VAHRRHGMPPARSSVRPKSGRVVEELKTFISLKPHEVSNFP
jgi:hypothetical protein